MTTTIDHSDLRSPRTSAGTLWRSWIVYALSSVASRLVGFLMLPIYTRLLSPEEYGIRAMVTVGVDLVGMVCSLGLTTAMIRHYTGDGGDDSRHPEAISTAYATGAAVLGVGVTLGMLGAPWLSILVLGDAAHAGYLRLGLISLFFVNTMDIGLAYLRLRQRAVTVAVVSFATLGVTVAANLVLVVWLRWGVAGILYGEIVTFGVFSVILARLTLGEVGLRLSPALARQMITYGAPLTLMPFAWLLVNRSDGVFLTHYGSLAATGVYALAIQCAQVLLLAVVLPFRDAWEPGQFDVVRHRDGGHTYQRMFQTFSFAVVVAAFTMAIGADDVIRVMAAPRFHGAVSVVPILLAAHVVMGMSLFFNAVFLVENRTALLGAIALFTGLVNVAANALLVPRYLAAGAAGSRLLALVVMAILTYGIGRRLSPHRLHFVPVAKVLLLAVAGFAVSRLLPDEMPLVSLALKATLVPLLVAASVLVGAVDRDDVRRVAILALERLRWQRARPAPGPVH